MTDRLELTWPNKDRFLLSPRDADGKPVWVDRNHPGAVEVRGHEFTGEYGEVGDDPYADNLLITGDSHDALRMLCEVPEFRRHYRGKVKLVYIDPPFNTGQTFTNYDDWLDHSTWLSMLRARLEGARDLLAADGSLWLHLDDVEQHRARVLLDEVFGASNFIATIVWEKTHTRENRAAISVSQDYIHGYARHRSGWAASRSLLPQTADQLDRYKNPDGDARGPWVAQPAHAKAEVGRRAAQFYTYTTPAGRQVDPPPGRCWVFTRERMEEMVADGRIWFGRDGGGMPAVKRFLSEATLGLVPTTLWKQAEVGTTATAKAEMLALHPSLRPFSTPKPEALLQRLLLFNSNPGDIVLDCFAGSGTTLAVAHKLARRWVAVELNGATVDDYLTPRLHQVVRGADSGGISVEAGWVGGGGFRTLSMLPPLYGPGPSGSFLLTVEPDDPRVVRGVAGQLGFEFAIEPPFVGRRGRMRLAYVPGAVGPEDVVELTGALGSDERLTVVALVVLEGTERALAEASPGSRLLKLPRDVLTTKRRRGEDQ